MAQMLRHKETGELFVYTDLLSKLSELEPVFDDPVAAVIAEVQAEASMEIPVFAPEAPAEDVATKSAPGHAHHKDKIRRAK